MMTYIVGSIIWLFAVAMLLYIIHTAIKPNGLIKKSDRFYRKRPNISFAVVLSVLIAAVALYFAHEADTKNDAELRWQMMPHILRGTT